MNAILRSKKKFVICIFLGVIVGYLIGVNLPSVKASYDHQIYGELTTLNSRLNSLNQTFKSIDSRLSGRIPKHRDYGQEQPGGLASIAVELEKLADAIKRTPLK